MPSQKRRLTVSLKRQKAMTVSRVTIGKKRLVYALVADKKLKYPKGKSRIAYIGTTAKGMERIAKSAAYRSDEILTLHGVNELEARIITCARRQNVETWRKLERALILTFRTMYGEPPIENSHGTRMKEADEFHYFSRARIRTILEELA